MGIMYLAAHLRTKFDLDIRLVNQRAENYTEDELVRQIVDFDPQIVGFGAMTPAAHTLPMLTRAVRAALPDTLIMLGGPNASALGAKALDGNAADVAVSGEGELACEQILNVYLDNRDFSMIPGLHWRNEDGEAVTNPGALPFAEDLDSLPFPAYDLIDPKVYWHLQSMPPIPRRRYVSLVSSRGCPYRCSWCHHIFGKSFRAHSPERMVDEIEYCVKTYGNDDIEFVDDIFNLKSNRVLEFNSLIHKKNLKLKIAFPNGVRSDLLSQETVDALADAGTYFCSFALESGSPRIQKLMGKRLDIPKFLAGVEMAAKKGIFTNGFNMLGFPTEVEEEMQLTIDTASNSMLHTASFFTVVPFPNTELHAYVEREAPEKLVGISYDDADFCLAPMNLSAVPNERFFRLQRGANRQFFSRPGRLFRILRDFPQPHRLPAYMPILASRLVKGIFGGKS